MPKIKSIVAVGGLVALKDSIFFRNPRDLRVAVFIPEDWDREMLSQQLKRIGCHVTSSWPPTPKLPDKTDLVFCAVMVQQSSVRMEWMGLECVVPVIAVVNYENPTILELALRMGAKNILMSPFRSSGVLSILTSSLHVHEEHLMLRQKNQRIEKKLQFSGLISDAKAVLMRTGQMSNTDAYERLRGQAMARRIPIEEVARSVIDADTLLSKTF
jgi:AmiR/NasT family two-component response regulator